MHEGEREGEGGQAMRRGWRRLVVNSSMRVKARLIGGREHEGTVVVACEGGWARARTRHGRGTVIVASSSSRHGS